MLSLVASLGLFEMAGCQKEAAPAPAPVVVVAEKAVATPAPLPAVAPAATLADLLQKEAAARPDGALRAEDALAAFARGGLAVEGTKQVVARTVMASYCVGGLTRAGTLVALCEYASPEAARAGREHSLSAFASAAPGREILVNRQTTLTLAPSPGHEDETKQLAAMFAKL
jgi:hypothetical protein